MKIKLDGWKKIAAVVVGGIVQTLPLDHDTKINLTALLVTYILGQGVADAGKEKAKIQANPPQKL